MLPNADVLLKKSPFALIINDRAKLINDEVGSDAFQFISNHSNIRSPGSYILREGHEFEKQTVFKAQFSNIIDLTTIEIEVKTNEFISLISGKLRNDGLFIGRFHSYLDTNDADRMKIQSTKRNTSKKKNELTNSRKFIKTKLNLFGRFSYYGFEIISEKLIGCFNYFVAKKISNPSEKPLPGASPIIKLNRIGKGGKIISIYKLRTMYPFSEYLQDYIFKNNQLENSGKFNNDFRILRMGKFLRKYWIDELPMLINLIKGDIKLFGVRPLSQQYFNLYPQELKELRTKFKPGLIPPYYVDLPDNFEAIVKSELKYLKEYQKNPIWIDFNYTLKAIFNILIKSKRSK